MKMTEKKQETINALKAKYGHIVSRTQVLEWTKENISQFEGSVPPKGVDFPYWITNNKEIRVGRGSYDLNLLSEAQTFVDTEDKNTLSA